MAVRRCCRRYGERRNKLEFARENSPVGEQQGDSVRGSILKDKLTEQLNQEELFVVKLPQGIGYSGWGLTIE